MAQLDDIVGSVMKKLKDTGRRRQHHRRLHDRQRRGELHLARRRPDAVRRRQGHGARRRLPRAVHRALAGQGAGRQGRERHHLRARLVPDLRRRRRQPQHRRRAKQGKELGEHDLQGPPRRLQPDGPDHRQGAVEAPRDLLLRRGRRSAPCASATTSTASSTSRTAGSAARSRSTGRSWSTSASTRSSAPGLGGRVAELLQLVRVRVLAVRRSCSRRSAKVGPDLRSSSRRCRRARASTSKP